MKRKHSAVDSSLFLVGKDSHGNWIAQDQSGLCGGLFVERAAAVKFALSENGNRHDAIVMVTGPLELEIARTASSAHGRQGERMLRRVA